jgi:hypothetical protein
MTMEVQGKEDLDLALRRIEAWFRHEMLDRPPVRFAEHNADFARVHAQAGRTWNDLKSRWFDAQYQIDYFVESIRGRAFLAETIPVFWPNLGPNVYAAFHGAELEYGEVTSWIRHCVHNWGDAAKLKFSWDNPYFKKIEELTRLALDQCAGRYLVGYTDLHGSLDCAADWRDPQALCVDLMDCPEKVHELVRLAEANFLSVFDHYDTMLKSHGQLSVTWMGIPARGKLHISSCDFTALVSTEVFEEFYLPSLLKEVKHMTHNIFHLDGKGMLRHLDRILEVPELHAVQWVQGVGDDLPILQWLPVITRIQSAGKGVIVDLQHAELEAFISRMRPEGLYLCISAPESIQPDILRRLEQWTTKHTSVFATKNTNGTKNGTSTKTTTTEGNRELREEEHEDTD